MLLHENHEGNTVPAETVRVACVGDSITESSEYPSDLWMMLGAGYVGGNFGAGGSAVSLKFEKPYMNQTAFQKATEFQPDIVVIMLGTNDAIPAAYEHIDDFVGDYEKLIAAFQTLASKPRILLVKPPPIFSDSLGPKATNSP